MAPSPLRPCTQAAARVKKWQPRHARCTSCAYYLTSPETIETGLRSQSPVHKAHGIRAVGWCHTQDPPPPWTPHATPAGGTPCPVHACILAKAPRRPKSAQPLPAQQRERAGTCKQLNTAGPKRCSCSASVCAPPATREAGMCVCTAPHGPSWQRRSGELRAARPASAPRGPGLHCTCFSRQSISPWVCIACGVAFTSMHVYVVGLLAQPGLQGLMPAH